MQKRTFLRSALRLTASAFLMRLISMGYRIYLTNQIGPEGMGLYQLIDTVFVFAVTVSTSGISLSVSKIVSAARSSGNGYRVRESIRTCVLFALLLSVPAMLSLLFLSGWIGTTVLHDSRVVLPLRILSLGLPFMAVCSCMKGYFLAVRGTGKTVLGELLEQFVTISSAVLLFLIFTPASAGGYCRAIVAGSSLGEAASCLFTFALYRLETGGQSRIRHGGCTLRQVSRTVLPLTVSSALRSGLTVAENILLPLGLRKNGANPKSALAEYGILSGMVLPMLFFPAVLLLPASSLLVPELTEALTRKQYGAIRRLSENAVRVTLLFSLFLSVFFFCFSKELGLLFYHSGESALLLRLLAPLVPLWYLDFIVDGLLKGLDQQLASLRYNLIDAAMRVCLVLLLIPHIGTKGYVLILFCSGIVNAFLSLRRLLRFSGLRIPVFRWVALPLFAAALSVFGVSLLLNRIPLASSFPAVLLPGALLFSALGYYLLLRLSGSIQKTDILRAKSLFSA